MDIDALFQNFRDSRKGREEEEEEWEAENDILIDEKKCRVKTYHDSVENLKELQEFAVQRIDWNNVSAGTLM
jgi:hypothetical protein